MNDATVYLESTEGQVVAPGAVLAHLDDPKVPEAPGWYLARLSLVNLQIYPPGARGPFLTQSLMLFLHLFIEFRVIREIYATIEEEPVDAVVRALKMPVEQHVSHRVAVLYGVASRL